MNKTIVWVTAIIAVACVAVFYVWSTYNRYYITAVRGYAVEVDQKTGKSWLLIKDRKIAHREAPR